MNYLERKEKINAAIKEADAAFWEVIKKHFPDVKNQPDQLGEKLFQDAQRMAVANYIINQ
jgi:hypothetical protein